MLLIRHLDGKTSKESLVDVLASAIESDEIKLEEDEQTKVDESNEADEIISCEVLQELVNEGLKALSDAMLLSGDNS